MCYCDTLSLPTVVSRVLFQREDRSPLRGDGRAVRYKRKRAGGNEDELSLSRLEFLSGAAHKLPRTVARRRGRPLESRLFHQMCTHLLEQPCSAFIYTQRRGRRRRLSERRILKAPYEDRLESSRLIRAPDPSSSPRASQRILHFIFFQLLGLYILTVLKNGREVPRCMCLLFAAIEKRQIVSPPVGNRR